MGTLDHEGVANLGLELPASGLEAVLDPVDIDPATESLGKNRRHIPNLAGGDEVRHGGPRGWSAGHGSEARS